MTAANCASVSAIGVGSGMRAKAWLDGFKAFDAEQGTDYYPKLRFWLGDYSEAIRIDSHDADAYLGRGRAERR